jgi:enoyl-[acyl-carrier protein] reductase I
VLPCDVTKDDDIAGLFDALRSEWGALDGLLHAIAFAPREALAGDFLDGMSRSAFAVAHDVSSYSLAALAKGRATADEGAEGCDGDAHLPRCAARLCRTTT